MAMFMTYSMYNVGGEKCSKKLIFSIKPCTNIGSNNSSSRKQKISP